MTDAERAKRLKRARLFDMWVPHFSTRQMAMKRIGRSSLYDIVCCMDEVEPGEVHDGIGTISSFILFGYGYFPMQIGQVKPWRNPHDKEARA